MHKLIHSKIVLRTLLCTSYCTKPELSDVGASGHSDY